MKLIIFFVFVLFVVGNEWRIPFPVPTINSTFTGALISSDFGSEALNGTWYYSSLSSPIQFYQSLTAYDHTTGLMLNVTYWEVTDTTTYYVFYELYGPALCDKVYIFANTSAFPQCSPWKGNTMMQMSICGPIANQTEINTVTFDGNGFLTTYNQTFLLDGVWLYTMLIAMNNPNGMPPDPAVFNIPSDCGSSEEKKKKGVGKTAMDLLREKLDKVQLIK